MKHTYLNKIAVFDNGAGGVATVHFSEQDMQKYGYSDEDQFISWYMNRIQPGVTYEVTTDIPRDQNGKIDKSEREHWSLINKKLIVDPIKKQVKLDKIAADKSKEDALLAKLKITKEDLEIIKKKVG